MLRQFATFALGDSLFAVDVLMVREVNRDLEITEVEPSPEFVMGLMNLRGQIVTILDLGVRLGLGRRKVTGDSCCIVLKTNRELERLVDEGLVVEQTAKDTIGLFVDRIGDMIAVEEDEIDSPPANIDGVDGKYLCGVIKLEDRLVASLKIGQVMAM